MSAKKNKTPQNDIPERVDTGASSDFSHIMAEFDKESAFRTLTGYRGTIITVVLILFSLIQLYSSWRIIPATHMRPLHLGIVTMLTYLLYPIRHKGRKDTLPIYDVILAVLSLLMFLFPIVYFEQIARQNAYPLYQLLIGAAAILLLIEACRRVVGLPIIIIAGVFIVIGIFGRAMPGFLGNRGFSLARIITHLFYTTEGIFGTPVGASSTFIFLFILFGSFLEKTGVGEFFIDLSNAIAGHKRGGPAKVAVITSALEGTVSGSSVANTVGSGSFTIPMMKSLGYRPEFAAAVEASASTGGQIMPPIMGAAAFLMSEALGLSYSIIIKAAVIPALLYFSGIYIVTDLEAKKQGLVGIEKSKLPKLKKILLARGHLLLPLIAIVVTLSSGFTPSFAALFGILLAVIGSYLRTVIDAFAAVIKGKAGEIPRILKSSEGVRPLGFLQALENGARSIIGVALACGVAGIIAGMITLTGLGLKIGAGLSALAGGSLLLLLLFTMLASILLGMGVPTTANYLITSTIMAPAVAKALMAALPSVYQALEALPQGASMAVLPAHLFTFYFGIIADITPPVALAAMAGAAIAKSNPFKTGVEATKLAIAAFLIPYIFVYNPQMLMLNAQWYEILQIGVTAMIGMLGVGMCIERYYLTKLTRIEQLGALAGGLLLIAPGLTTDLVGIVLVAAVILWQRKKSGIIAKRA